MCVISVITTVSLLSDIYMYAVLVCCIGILSVLLFTLTIVWQSVFSKRKSSGKRTECSCLEWEHSQTTDSGRPLGEVSTWLKKVAWVRNYVSVTGQPSENLLWSLLSFKSSFFSNPFLPSFCFKSPYLCHSPRRGYGSWRILGLILALPLETEFLETFLSHSELQIPHYEIQ